HRFLDAVRDGTIADQDFNRWLVQDALFVRDLLTFQARLLARAVRPAQTALAAGCAALVSELDWFDEQAAARAIDMNQPALPATLA
ncbi:TenA family transcriptional regulator, partial [Mycobacterium sp. ITM-2017-0098]